MAGGPGGNSEGTVRAGGSKIDETLALDQEGGNSEGIVMAGGPGGNSEGTVRAGGSKIDETLASDQEGGNSEGTVRAGVRKSMRR